MKSVTWYAIAVLAAFIAITTEAAELDEVHCKELIVEGVKRAMKEASKCTKQLNFKSKEEKKERAACIMKCVAINIGLLNPKGEIDEKLLLIFVDENVPLKYHDIAFQIMGDCMHHAGNLDPNEENCKSYDPVFKCVTDSATKFAKLCTDQHP